MSDVRLIAAVGKRGQIGFEGRLPWHDPKDLRWFREQTAGGILIAGTRTAETLPLYLQGAGDRNKRTLYTALEHHDCGQLIDFISRVHPGRTIWIIGGAHTYKAFMPFVRRCVITRIDYDGPADTWMPELWEARAA